MRMFSSLCFFCLLVAFSCVHATGDTFTVPFTFKDEVPHMQIMVGTPPQKMTAVFANDVADSWIITDSCKQCQEVHPGWSNFNMTLSKSLRKTSKHVEQNCVNGERTGNYVSDTIFVYGSNYIMKQFPMVATETNTCMQYSSAHHEYDMIMASGGETSIAVQLPRFYSQPPYFRLDTKNHNIVFGDVTLPKDSKWTSFKYNSMNAIAGEKLIMGSSSVNMDEIILTVFGTNKIEVNSYMMNFIARNIGAEKDFHGVYHVSCYNWIPAMEIYTRESGIIEIYSHEYVDITSETHGMCNLNFVVNSRIYQNRITIGADILSNRGIVFDAEQRRVALTSVVGDI